MRTKVLVRPCLAILLFFCLPTSIYAQGSCATAVTLVPALGCSGSSVSGAGDLKNAVAASPAPVCGSGSAYSSWFKFTATSPSVIVTLNNLGAGINSGLYLPYVEVLTGTCGGSFSSLGCQQSSSGTSGSATLTVNTLTTGTVYYVRVYNTSLKTNGSCGFNVCVQSSPNDDCSGAITLTPGASCSNVSGSLDLSTATSGLPAGCESGGTHYDVWYTFKATSTTHIVTISSLVGIASPEIQLYSGSCGSLSSVTCGSNTLTAQGLTIGNFYFVRVSNVGSSPTGSSFNICVVTPPSNDECSGAISLSPNTTCSTTSGTMVYATASPGVPQGCYAAGTYYDVWYSFVANQTSATVTLGSMGASFSSPQLQVYRGTCGSLTSIQCGTTSATATGLTIGNTYYVRVSNLNTPISATGNFSICVTAPPSNDDCANAITLYSNSTCTTTSATLASATPSAGIPLGCAAAGTYNDVWFTFTAANASETITASGFTGVTTSAVQLYSGSCGALTSLACGTTSIAATGLTTGSTYYVRVSSVNAAATGTGNFNICITHPAPTTTVIDYGKSYVNISKNAGGGTISPGDTLEIRATLVIKSGSAGLDSLAFLDTMHLGAGVRLVPGSIALRTNEGKVYNSFTDAVGDDAGYSYTSGTDTVVRINFGAGASATTRGKLLNTSKPSVFGSTCIIMATYRVVVYAGYGSTLSLGGGKLTGSTSPPIVNDYTFSPRTAMVYSSPGLCPNAVSPSNAIGADFNGTFGSGTAQNRGPSGNVLGYTYATFAPSNPQDYYYGIANNTSVGGTGFSTVTTWAKPDGSSPSHRVFNQWDITGDHTGASNPTKGNLPCDPSKPQSATNPCGYMLVVNSAYRTDTAYQYTVSNLCPNTYYEISAWFKNICYKCGCDSNGVQSNGAGYIPSALNDSSGVQPNITYDINGADYYTTGNIVYGGLFPSTQTGSDSNNTWVKRGFTYLTGPAQTSFTLTLRNNAPGGGGNDWAMDDISLATCLPNMQYSPSLTPTTCNNNVFQINDTIRSYFSNYQYYKWQVSNDGGTTWSDISGATGSGTPGWNGSAYQYIASYTLPTSATTLANSGDKYRVVVGTTSGSLSNTNCQVTDGVSQISLSVVDCSTPLGTNIISFNANAANKRANLYWTTNRETDQVQFDIERSVDGINFNRIGRMRGLHSADDVNRYSFVDTLLPVKSYYRISLADLAGRKIYSRIMQLQTTGEFTVSNVTNYFETGISLDVNVTRNSQVTLTLLNGSGNVLKTMVVNAYAGTNNYIIPSLTTLSRGVYILQVRNEEKTVTVKAIKK